MALGVVKSDTASLPMVKDAWVEIRTEINLATNTVSEYYNNQLLRTRAWQDGAGLDELQAMDLFANGTDPVYYDNLSVVQNIPEAGTTMTLLLGGLGFLWRRRVK
jgi:hypothetical protein